LAELQLTICDGSEKSPESNLRHWLNKLVHVGVISRQREPDGKLTSNGTYRYRLEKELGPKAPVVRAKTGAVFDPNSGEILEAKAHE
jgi:hypothetical protein